MGLTILDTNVALYAMQNKLVNNLPAEGVGISVISEIELLSFPELSEAEELSITAMIAELQIFPLTEDVKRLTISLRQQHRLKVPDAIIAATAMAEGAELLTNDKRLQVISGLACRSVDLRSETV